MGKKVSDSVKKETTKCQHQFACLSKEKCGDLKMCEVDYVDGDKILFLKTRESNQCPYRTTFASRQICRCPTHFALKKQA